MQTPELYLSATSSPSSSTSSPVHAASLVDPAMHSTALLELVEVQLSRPVIEYIVDCVSETVDHAMGRSPSPRGRSAKRSSTHTKFTDFVSTVLSRAEVTPATALTSLVYVSRARPHLSIAMEEWALERVFLGALIVASKYTNDSTLKNVHWALCTGVFGKRDVGRIEREFLEVLDWELGVSEADILAHHEGVMEAFGARRHFRTQPIVAVPRRHQRTTSIPIPIPMPDLEESSSSSSSDSDSDGSSSPASSLQSLSPRTPLSLSVNSEAPEKDYVNVTMDVPMDVEQGTSTSGGRFHDLLRAFPIPIHQAVPVAA